MTSSENDVITRTLGASAGGKTAEKIPVTYHFVISIELELAKLIVLIIGQAVSGANFCVSCAHLCLNRNKIHTQNKSNEIVFAQTARNTPFEKNDFVTLVFSTYTIICPIYISKISDLYIR